MTKLVQARAAFFMALEKAKSITDAGERGSFVARARESYIDALNEGVASPELQTANAAGVDQALASMGFEDEKR